MHYKYMIRIMKNFNNSHTRWNSGWNTEIFMDITSQITVSIKEKHTGLDQSINYHVLQKKEFDSIEFWTIKRAMLSRHEIHQLCQNLLQTSNWFNMNIH